MTQERVQTQRFELKYVIPEATASAVRDFASAYLRLDAFGARNPDRSYSVHSLYLDSEPLTTCWDTINGNRNRYKLRLRFYAARPESPVFFEIKQRDDNAVLKQRSQVRRDAVAWLLGGNLPDDAHLMPGETQDLAALERFCRLMNRIQAVPKARVSYRREAWTGNFDEGFRVTFDRKIQFDPESTARLEVEMKDPVEVFGNSVVLELKFAGTYPTWAAEMVRVFGLTQRSAAKYVDGVALAGEERITRQWQHLRDPQAAGLLEARRQALESFV